MKPLSELQQILYRKNEIWELRNIQQTKVDELKENYIKLLDKFFQFERTKKKTRLAKYDFEKAEKILKVLEEYC